MLRIRSLTITTLLTVVATFLASSPSSADPLFAVVARAVTVDAQASDTGVLSVAAPIQFTVVGITYPGRSTNFEVRTRLSSDDLWSEWLEVDTDEAEGPDHRSSSARLASSPVWTGLGKQMQVRAEDGGALPPKLTVHFMDATGEALSTPEKVIAWAKGQVRTPVAHAGPRPQIISRSEWGADESLRRCDSDYANSVKGSFLHHTASSNDYGPSDSAAIVRSILYYHTQVRGWCDIGYNFLVDRYGATFEGRSGGADRPVIGAHAAGFNTGSTGIAMIGDLSGTAATFAGADAITRLLGWKFTIHRVLPKGSATWTSGGGSRYPEGTVVTLPTISGHKDVSSTACPARLYELLPAFRNAVVVDFKHPDGTLIKGSGPAVYYVDSGRRRGIASASIFVSRFDWSSLIGVSDYAFSLYQEGPPLGFRDGVLIRTPDGTVSIVSSGKRRGFVTQDAFLGMGFSYANVKHVTYEEARIHPEGLPIALSSEPHPTGSLLKGSDSLIYYIEDSTKRPIPSAGIFESRFEWEEVLSVPDSRVSQYPQGEFVGYRDGSLLLTPDGTVWVISNGERRGFTSGELFLAMGYSFSNIRSVSFGEAFLSREGPVV